MTRKIHRKSNFSRNQRCISHRKTTSLTTRPLNLIRSHTATPSWSSRPKSRMWNNSTFSPQQLKMKNRMLHYLKSLRRQWALVPVMSNSTSPLEPITKVNCSNHKLGRNPTPRFYRPYLKLELTKKPALLKFMLNKTAQVRDPLRLFAQRVSDDAWDPHYASIGPTGLLTSSTHASA